MKQEVQFALKGEYITLDALMKAAGLAGTGGEAKVRIQGGEVKSTVRWKRAADVSFAAVKWLNATALPYAFRPKLNSVI